jgi:hypothetical protein
LYIEPHLAWGFFVYTFYINMHCIVHGLIYNIAMHYSELL